VRNIPTKYNTIIRIWTYAFHRLLESLRHASFNSCLALERLQDFIYYAYTFYTGSLEEQTLWTFRAGWREALGDLARYRMAVAAVVTSSRVPVLEELTAAAVLAVLSVSPHQFHSLSVVRSITSDTLPHQYPQTWQSIPHLSWPGAPGIDLSKSPWFSSLFPTVTSLLNGNATPSIKTRPIILSFGQFRVST